MAGLVEYHFFPNVLGEHTWTVVRLRAEEQISLPYRVDLDLRCDEPHADLASLLGVHVLVEIRRGGQVRRIAGIVRSIDEGFVDHDHIYTTAEIVPALWFLSQRRDTRIFQSQRVPEILEAVLGEALAPYGRNLQLELSGDYLPREHCVQYEESDLDFAHRLMEEEGIHYAFDHEGESELLTLRDRNDAYPRIPTADGTVPFSIVHAGTSEVENVYAFSLTDRHTTTAVQVRDQDWTRPSTSYLGPEQLVDAIRPGQDSQGRTRESYEHRRTLTITNYQESVLKYQAQDAARQAQIRQELHRRDATTGAGESRLSQLTAGQQIELLGHPGVGVDGAYLVTSIVHENQAPEAVEGAEVDAYRNRFTVIPLETPYRPNRRTHKPRIHGAQTAVVTGPSGEEIHTDEHGRIKVQFHWDRLGEYNERSSCWVRVSQSWAGPGWGFVFIPRIGMEVIVTFLEGDPDRPLVTGSVYNGTNRPPYELPAEKTKSTIKSNSSLGGDGYNEFRFEDKKGEEEIFTHAEKDYNEVVEHDHNTLVHHCQTNTVDVDQTEVIGRDQRMTAGRDRGKRVGRDERTTVGRNRSEMVGSNESIIIGVDENIRIGRDRKTSIHGTDQLRVQKEIDVHSQVHILLVAGCSAILIKGK